VYYQTYFIGKKAGETFFLKLIYKKIDVNPEDVKYGSGNLVALAQIILFLKILKFSKKKNFKENSFVKENGKYFEMFWIILFGNGISTIN
jgi:hypothetical protein